MTDRRRVMTWAATSTRLVVGAAAAAVAVLAVVVGVAAPWPTLTLTLTAAGVEATPAASDTVVSCAGALLALGRNSLDASELQLAADQSVVHASDGATATADTLTPVPSIADDAGAAVYTAAPVDGTASDVAAAGSASLDATDLRGFAASACRPAQMESWLVGGSTATGSADLVLLSNPGDVPATVDLTVYGAQGAQTPTGATGIVVAPGTQRIVALAGIVVGEQAPAVRVTATGAPVTAVLQSSITRTLLPGGVDQIAATSAADTELVIPGVVVTDSAVASADAGATTLVRLLSAQTDTEANVTVAAVDGSSSSTQQVPLHAGVPAELELSGLVAGTYTVTVEAAVAVVGAVWQTTSLGEGADFAWYAQTPEVTGETLVAVPEGPSPTFVATAADAAADIVLEPVTGASDEVTLSVAANGSGQAALVPGAVYRLTTSAAVHATVSYSGDGQLAGIPVWPADAASSVLTVYP
ncbi:MAG: DUF5719 family protein [Microbacterium sp.]|uniref:DUF5719 family protein n=1 Tax=Microbacterium sp. TaxID=51671 RepID=UPI0039E22B7A